MSVLTPVVTSVVRSLPAAHPDNPAAGRKTVRPGNVVRQNPGRRNFSNALLGHAALSTCAVGTSSMMLTVITPVAVSPLASVTLW